MATNPALIEQPTQLPSAVAIAIPADNGDLPNEWKEAVHESSGQKYYYNESTGEYPSI